MTVWVLFITMWVGKVSATKKVEYLSPSECLYMQSKAAQILDRFAPQISYKSECVTTFKI